MGHRRPAAVTSQADFPHRAVKPVEIAIVIVMIGKAGNDIEAPA